MEFDSFERFNFMHGAASVFITVIFVIIFVTIIVKIVQGTKQWSKNNKSPVLIVPANVTSKRTDVTYYHHSVEDNMDHMNSSTTYYITFQVESGDRMEFSVSGEEYGLLVEGDSGKLTFQGTRYLGFERQ